MGLQNLLHSRHHAVRLLTPRPLNRFSPRHGRGGVLLNKRRFHRRRNGDQIAQRTPLAVAAADGPSSLHLLSPLTPHTYSFCITTPNEHTRLLRLKSRPARACRRNAKMQAAEDLRHRHAATARSRSTVRVSCAARLTLSIELTRLMRAGSPAGGSPRHLLQLRRRPGRPAPRMRGIKPRTAELRQSAARVMIVASVATAAGAEYPPIPHPAAAADAGQPEHYRNKPAVRGAGAVENL